MTRILAGGISQTQSSVPTASGAGHTFPIATWGRRLLLFWCVTLGMAFIPAVPFPIVLTVLNLSAFAAAIFGLRYAPLGFLGISVLCTVDALVAPLLLTGGLFRWNTLNYWLLLVMLAWFPYLIRLADLNTRMLQLFIVLIALELLVTPDLMGGVQHLLGIVTMFGVVVYVARGMRDAETCYWTALGAGVVGALCSGAFVYNMLRLPYVNPNVWSYVAVTAILVICLNYPFLDRTPRRQALLGVLAVVNTGWAFLSTSRGSFLVALLGLLFLLLTTPNLRRSVVQLGVGGLVCLALVSQFAQLKSTSFQRIQLLLDPEQSTRARTSGRFDLVMVGLYMFEDHPFGVGSGGFPLAWANLGRREGITNFKFGKPFPAHSGWVKILGENGAPGILLLVGYVASFAIVGIRQRTWRRRLLGFFAAAVLGVAWISTEFYFKGLWFLAAGVTVVLNQAPFGRPLTGRR